MCRWLIDRLNRDGQQPRSGSRNRLVCLPASCPPCKIMSGLHDAPALLSARCWTHPPRSGPTCPEPVVPALGLDQRVRTGHERETKILAGPKPTRRAHAQPDGFGADRRLRRRSGLLLAPAVIVHATSSEVGRTITGSTAACGHQARRRAPTTRRELIEAYCVGGTFVAIVNALVRRR
jgi:hypothetical protein